MKISELRKLSKNELVEKSNSSLGEYKVVKLALKCGDLSPENVNKSRALKKGMARMKTILNELNLVSQNEN